MKNIFLTLSLVSGLSYGAGGNWTGIPSQLVARDGATSTIGLLYSSASSEVFSNMAGKQNFSIFNGSGTSLGVAVRSNTCSSSSQDNFMVPANTGLVIEDVAMAKALCIRSLSGNSITTGVVLLSVW